MRARRIIPWFVFVQEVDIGIAADLGTLQRMPKSVGNGSLVRELAFTARKFDAEEAKSLGFVRYVYMFLFNDVVGRTPAEIRPDSPNRDTFDQKSSLCAVI